ncbi:hypothetical protein WJX73_006043 [Symbiochloris irregularis]|uniref:Reverse transcriptase domain-containing protein n=1 Tax=Symbiochloris irregularis TaxID=706552 RepID=A0AAW1NNN4_9CHLO
MNLRPLPMEQGRTYRRHTYRPHAADNPSSRIDDILISPSLEAIAAPEQHIVVTRDSDHSPLLASLDVRSLGFTLAPPCPIRERQPRLKTPVCKQGLANFKSGVALEHAGEIRVLKRRAADLLKDAAFLTNTIGTAEHKAVLQTNARREIAEHVVSLGEQIQAFMTDKVMQCATACLEFTGPATPTHTHGPNTKAHRVLTENLDTSRKLQKSVTELQDLAELKEAPSEDIVQYTQSALEGIREVVTTHNAQHKRQLPEPPQHDDIEFIGSKGQGEWNDWRRAAEGNINQLGRERKGLYTQKRDKGLQKARSYIQHMYATNQKGANKIINGIAKSTEITALKDGAGKVVHDAQLVRKLAHEYYQKQATPVATMTEQHESSDHFGFEWEDEKLDGFKIETKVGKPGYGTLSIFNLMKDKARFDRHLGRLSNNKAPGPDQVANELIKNLPEELLETIHTLYILMYVTATTPQHFKESSTILLHKKGDPLMLQNYRPICLANTVSKLYTCMLASSIAQFAEHYDVLSNSQEGFRSRRNTTRCLQLFHNILVDAKLTHKDLYAMYIDFSSAFNTVSHNRLLIIMRELGFPEDCLEVIKSIYDGATTVIQVAGGGTDPVKIMRGTLQGDSLSPLLFIIFMEPLTRWLQSRGRGATPGCLKTGVAPKGVKSCTIGCLGYADDLLALTNSARDLAIQALKIERFAKFSGLDINVGKCAVSAILHGRAEQKGISSLGATLMISSQNNGYSTMMTSMINCAGSSQRKEEVSLQLMGNAE